MIESKIQDEISQIIQKNYDKGEMKYTSKIPDSINDYSKKLKLLLLCIDKIKDSPNSGYSVEKLVDTKNKLTLVCSEDNPIIVVSNELSTVEIEVPFIQPIEYIKDYLNTLWSLQQIIGKAIQDLPIELLKEDISLDRIMSKTDDEDLFKQLCTRLSENIHIPNSIDLSFLEAFYSRKKSLSIN